MGLPGTREPACMGQPPAIPDLPAHPTPPRPKRRWRDGLEGGRRAGGGVGGRPLAGVPTCSSTARRSRAARAATASAAGVSDGGVEANEPAGTSAAPATASTSRTLRRALRSISTWGVGQGGWTGAWAGGVATRSGGGGRLPFSGQASHSPDSQHLYRAILPSAASEAAHPAPTHRHAHELCLQAGSILALPRHELRAGAAGVWGGQEGGARTDKGKCVPWPWPADASRTRWTLDTQVWRPQPHAGTHSATTLGWQAQGL